ncbi:RagB/SusD family nutrient uptake outer membrane protein [Ochrovirga pacifica]|uniref:RagB/SusD family nutrient uptake outer membrane protein n=1 Tax=Ochrovirga pacifica TaxID=1042376 RepID=UPI000255A289|nr:RagB/SusD family nutrient uptake outer membrane protein [Ochrovirga pacifica]
MKNIKNFKKSSLLLFTTAILTLTPILQSCDDYVELDPVGPTSENYFNSPEEYEAALIGAYDMLQTTHWNVTVAVAASDDIIAGGDAANFDQPTLQRVDKMEHTPADNNQLRDVWKFMYAGMNRANYVLENQNKIDFDGKEEIIAQAYFLRAYYAFELAKFYGDIPLLTETREGVLRIANKQVSVGDEYNMNRVGSIAQVYSVIEEDLKEAINNLPVTQAEKYEITKGVAQALLGKVYLYHGKFNNAKFADAATMLGNVINSDVYDLVDFTTLFTEAGENSNEAVFEIQYTNVEGAGWDCIQCSEGNYFPKQNAPRNQAIAPYIAGWGFNLPTQVLYDTYEDDDVRRDVTIWDLRNDDSYEKSRENTGFFTKKYLPTQADENERAGSDPLNYSNNYRAIRYADVLLMAAEAEIQSGGSLTNAVSYLNQVRARAFGDNSHDFPYAGETDMLQAVYKERRLELAAEGHRFFDLVRTNQASQAFQNYNNTKPVEFGSVNYTEGKNEIFPIPTVELNLANATDRWGQNPNY